jgi:hypothetical protein
VRNFRHFDEPKIGNGKKWQGTFFRIFPHFGTEKSKLGEAALAAEKLAHPAHTLTGGEHSLPSIAPTGIRSAPHHVQSYDR